MVRGNLRLPDIKLPFCSSWIWIRASKNMRCLVITDASFLMGIALFWLKVSRPWCCCWYKMKLVWNCNISSPVITLTYHLGLFSLIEIICYSVLIPVMIPYSMVTSLHRVIMITNDRIEGCRQLSCQDKHALVIVRCSRVDFPSLSFEYSSTFNLLRLYVTVPDYQS